MAEKRNGSRIHRAIAQVMREVGAIGRDGKNKDQGYQYRSAEAVYNRVQPLFAKHGIFNTATVLDQKREEGKSRTGNTMHWSTVTVEYTFYADDGSSVSMTVVGEGMDSSDKASAKAMTIAHRTAICQLLNIPYQLSDPEQHTPSYFAQYVGRITRQELTDLKKRWIAKHNGYAGKSRDDVAKLFADWAHLVTNADFDPLLEYQWTRELYNECEAALSVVGPAPGYRKEDENDDSESDASEAEAETQQRSTVSSDAKRDSRRVPADTGGVDA